MIIAFYPGAGGNRYYRKLEGQEYAQTNKSYDHLVFQQFTNRYLIDGSKDQGEKYILTHCLNGSILRQNFPKRKICFILGDLKKCLRREWSIAGHDRFISKKISEHINQIEHYKAIKDLIWPVCNTLEEIQNLPPDIIKEINDDYQKLTIPTAINNGTLADIKKKVLEKVDSAYEMISWHLDYYKKYPLELLEDVEIVDISVGDDSFSEIMRHELSLYENTIFDGIWETLND